jgi:hypothetical protein
MSGSAEDPLLGVALDDACVEFIDENGGGAGFRCRVVSS